MTVHNPQEITLCGFFCVCHLPGKDVAVMALHTLLLHKST
ncbi:hypothetical protein PT7_1278 [Pusillimonas sp. T7-7]|nr:hypothetical protein PT7_1278 [Pusillimonas sp. T7-7]